MTSRRILLVLLLAGLPLGAGGAPGAYAASSLYLGFNDDQLVGTGDPLQLSEAMPKAQAAGGSIWRFAVLWKNVAGPKPDRSADSRDPAWAGYDWTAVDRTVRAIDAAGMKALPYVRRAPTWAEGSGRPAESPLVPAGTWRPSPTYLGAFAEALAKRYDGTYPDPLNPGATLPRVKYFQAWNEPNLYTDLTPQWRKSKGRWRPASPSHYRKMANAFYEGVNDGQRTAKVISAGTGPFGDLEDGDPRMPPVRFWRELLCVRDGKVPKARKCGVVRFDAIAHHPYPIGPPRRKARNDDDAVVPDVRKITRLTPAAMRAGSLRPKTKRKQLWITEYAWESTPDPDGVSLSEQAQYLQASLYVLWQQKAKYIVWWQFRDQAPRPSFAATFQSGIFARGDTVAQDEPKPAYTAFRFPFTAYRTNGVARLWGKTPDDRSVTIQARQGGRWVTATKLKAGSNHIFTGRLRVGPNTSLRAVAGPDTSLVWRTQ